MLKKLSLNDLIAEAQIFCQIQSQQDHPYLLGVSDGKAIGTYIEQRFKEFLQSKYELEVGNSAKGIDLPGAEINTDIKSTSIKNPQSSCPFKSLRQKVFGLGYNLLVFMYNKVDTSERCNLTFANCIFIEAAHTADYAMTQALIAMKEAGADVTAIANYLSEKFEIGDEEDYLQLAQEVLDKELLQGYLTISDALQWRLSYRRVISVEKGLEGIVQYGIDD